MGAVKKCSLYSLMRRGNILIKKEKPYADETAEAENVQAQYIPRQRTIFVRNGMSEEVTFHAINRELACAAMDSHDGTYSRAEVVPQAFCAAYVMAEKYGVDCSGFDLDKICEMQEYGNKEPQELRAFIGNVKNAVYRISRHINRNLGQPEQEFMPDEFAVSEGMKGEVPPPEMPKAEEPAEKPAEKSQKQKGGKSKKQAERYKRLAFRVQPHCTLNMCPKVHTLPSYFD